MKYKVKACRYKTMMLLPLYDPFVRCVDGYAVQVRGLPRFAVHQAGVAWQADDWGTGLRIGRQHDTMKGAIISAIDMLKTNVASGRYQRALKASHQLYGRYYA